MQVKAVPLIFLVVYFLVLVFFSLFSLTSGSLVPVEFVSKMQMLFLKNSFISTRWKQKRFSTLHLRMCL